MAPRLSATFDSGTNKVVNRTAALAGRKVLASLVFGGGLGHELLKRRWSTGLTDRVLSRTALTRSKGSRRRGRGECGGLGTVTTISSELGVGLEARIER